MFMPAPRRSAAVATVAILFWAIHSQAAQAVSLAVEIACSADYYAYCSQHDPDGEGVRKCMRANGPKLSKFCLKALVAAGEVSQSEIDARTAAAKK